MNHLEGLELHQSEFVNPPKECSVVYGWYWNAPATKEVIDKQLTEAAEAGIKGFYAAPLPKDFRPEEMRTFLEPEYLSDEFFEIIRYTIEKGRELGMEIWLYDEGGWPSGGACGHTMKENPEAVIQRLKRRRIEVAAGEKYCLAEDTIAAYEGKERVFGPFIAENDTQIVEYYAEEFIENGNRIDCTNPDVTDTFLQNTYEKYRECVGELFGKEISLMFTDEPGLVKGTIPKDLFGLFQEEYGYDLKDYLYAVYDEKAAETEAECQARMDYGRMLGKLFKENFCERITDWCDCNNILFSGHLDNEEVPDGGMMNGYFSHVDAFRAFDIPGIDEIWEQIRYPYNGREPMEKGSVFYPRLASSAARQTGKNLALTETFGVHGDGMTPDEMRYVVNYQAIRGINVFNFLCMALGRAGAGAMVERPVFCAEKPGFFHLKNINEYAARLSYLARVGMAEGDTALYYPASDFWANEKVREEAVGYYNDAGRVLEEKNIAFDIIDDYGILSAEICADGLRLGNALYRNIVVPECKYMPDDVQKKIDPFLGEGKPILHVKSPHLRVMTRRTDTGRLYFVFNQGELSVEELLEIPVTAEEKLYRLDLSSGEIFREEKAQIKLLCGDMAVYLVTKDTYDTVVDDVEYTIPVTDLKPVAVKQFQINSLGMEWQERETDAIADENFSGEITYAGEYCLPMMPKEGQRYRVVLEDTSVSATIVIGGERVAAVGITPMRALIPAEKLVQKGRIEIIVANTAANEILAKQDVINSWPKEEVGPYHERQCQFEVSRPPLRLGRVVLEKLI